MERHAKTVLWINLAVAIFFVMSYLSVEVIKMRILGIILGIIHQTSIFIIAGAVILSALYAIFLLFRKESVMLKIGLLVMVSANIFLTFILPGLKIGLQSKKITNNVTPTGLFCGGIVVFYNHSALTGLAESPVGTK